MSSFPLLTLRILSPDGISFEKDGLSEIHIPLADGGWIGIKPGHAPLIAETVRGAIRFRSEFEERTIELHPGVLDIREDAVILLTAGEVTQTDGIVVVPASREFPRLMKTMISMFQPGDDPSSETGHYD